MSRIFFLVSSMQGGGAERVAASLCNHWEAQGHDVTLMPTFSGRGECVYPLDQRVQIDYLADRVENHSQSLLNKARRYWTLRSAVQEIAPNVIVSFLPHVNVAAILSAWGLRIPVVVSERIHPPSMPLSRSMDALRKFTYPRATAVIVQTERTLAWLDSCCPKSRGSVIPNPVLYPLPRGEPFLKPTSIVDETKHLLLAVGRLDTQKGFDQLLTAFGMLAERLPHWDLVILGEGQERKALETQKDLLGLAGRAHLPGRVGNPGDWYTRGDCYVMSSRFEGFPNTLLEAMAHGLPAISFDCETGPADIIREGVDGYLVPPLEGAMGLSQTMEMVMQDEDLRRQMGKAAVTVRERFSSERVMCAWDKILGLQEKASRDGG